MSDGPEDDPDQSLNELGRFAAEARMRRQALENRDVDVAHSQQRLCLTGMRGESFEYSTLQAHVFGGNSKIPSLAARHPSPPSTSHSNFPALASPPPPPAPVSPPPAKLETLDPLLDQRLWLHEAAPTMEFSTECSRLAFGEQWDAHERMLERANTLRREIEEAGSLEEAVGQGGPVGEVADPNERARALANAFNRSTERAGGGIRADDVVEPGSVREGVMMSSVLKKRRKKMNKHKHKKRSKRDRGYGKA